MEVKFVEVGLLIAAVVGIILAILFGVKSKGSYVFRGVLTKKKKDDK